MSRARSSRASAAELSRESDSWARRVMRRNIASLSGLALLALVGAATVALATWHVDDPSLSNAVARPAVNLLGYPGAVFADLTMQFFGVAAPLLLLPALVWGWRLVIGSHTRFPKLAIASWPLGAIAAAAAIATLPVPESWPLPTGLGGASGDLVLRIPTSLAGGELSGAASIVTGLVFGLLAAFLVLHAIAVASLARSAPEPVKRGKASRAAPAVRPAPRSLPDLDEDDEDSDRPSRLAYFFGAAAHTGYRLKSSLGRLLKRRRTSDDWPIDEGDWTPPRTRREPTLSAPDADDELEEVDFEPDMPAEDDDLGEPAPRGKAPAKRKAPTGRRRIEGVFLLPSLDLLATPKQGKHAKVTAEMLEENARLLESVLDDFGIRGEIVNVRPGPVVTLYELEPAPGIKSSRVIGLADDIARSMSAVACRVAVIPGKNAIGIELPNEFRETVFLREQLASKDFVDTKARLPLCLGKDIGGAPIIADLSRMPHLLVAGTTGSGKSVAINTMILSLLYRLTPEACRLILIDPKMLELSTYDGIPHLLTPVVTDPKKAVVALKWTVREMEDRYRKMSKVGVRNIDGLNARIAEAREKDETITRSVHTGFDRETGEPIIETEELDLEPMPHIVVIIDEMADLMMVAGKDIEGAVQRLAQMARAAGIHVAMATQRPSVDVITGTIKANFPTRISFQVTSKIDSRTILGEQGAEQLLGQGDMLYMMGGGRITRVHGPFVTDGEVEAVVKHLKAQGTPEYLEAITEEEDELGEGMPGEDGGEGEPGDLYDQAVAIVLRDRKASTSYVQRRLAIGYNRAASLIERMEKEGVVGAANHAGKREILVDNGEDRL